MKLSKWEKVTWACRHSPFAVPRLTSRPRAIRMGSSTPERQQTCWSITKSSNCTNDQEDSPVHLETSLILDNKLCSTCNNGIAHTVTSNSHYLPFRSSPHITELPNFLAKTRRCCRSITSAETSWCIQRRVSAVILNSSFWPNQPLPWSSFCCPPCRPVSSLELPFKGQMLHSNIG
jgi:hypothetical protein